MRNPPADDPAHDPLAAAALAAWRAGYAARLAGPRGWWAVTALAWLGILGAGVASFVFYALLQSVGPTRASLVTYTLPVVGVALGVVILRERLDWQLVAGTLLIVSGVWVVNRR